MFRLYLFLLIGLLVLDAPRPATAAPYCTQAAGAGRECMYDDIVLCRKRAEELRGLCIANPTELRVTTGSAPYCMVSGDHVASCVYIDLQSCDIDAARAGQSECLDNGAVVPMPGNVARNPAIVLP